MPSNEFDGWYGKLLKQVQAITNTF